MQKKDEKYGEEHVLKIKSIIIYTFGGDEKV